MYYESAQGIDECIISAHYYYYYHIHVKFSETKEVFETAIAKRAIPASHL